MVWIKKVVILGVKSKVKTIIIDDLPDVPFVQ